MSSLRSDHRPTRKPPRSRRGSQARQDQGTIHRRACSCSPARLILAPQPERAAAPRSSHLVRGAFFGAALSGRATSRLRARTKSLRFTSWRSPSASCGLTRKRMLLLRAAGRSISSRRTQACLLPTRPRGPSAQAFVSEGRPTGVWGDRGCGRFPRLAGSNDEEGRLPGDETARIESIDHAVPNVRSKASLRSRGADCSAPKSFRIKASSELRPDL